MSLTFADYQRHAAGTAVYPKDVFVSRTQDESWPDETFVLYPTLGLCGEAGEVAEKVKKALRDVWPLDRLRQEVTKELGDVLWYAASICTDLGLDLGEVALFNLQKLAARKEAGTLQGSGDNR